MVGTRPAGQIRDWLDVITAARADARLTTRIWYPEPRGDLLDIGNGINAQVLIGAPAYQVSSGEIVAIEG
jgi:hypothetical protein